MRSIVAPNFGVRHILAAVGDGSRIRRVTAVADALAEEELKFLARCDGNAQWSTPHEPASVPLALKSDLAYAFKDKLSDKDGSARLFYNRLRQAPHGRCPLCLERDVAALDHYLPKERWHALALTPGNLYPICTVCNGIKLAKYASTEEDQFLHPYFDDLGDDDWLSADLAEVPGAPLSFSIEAPARWGETLATRVRKHFELFQLGDLYRDRAVTLLSSHQVFFTNIYSTAGSEALRQTLLELAESYKESRLSQWPSVAMRQWAASDWFCDGRWAP